MNTRRRLLVYSAPVVLVVMLLVAKLVSVAVAGTSAVSRFSDGDIEALSGDVATLQILNIVEPARTHQAAGALAVLEGRLEDADREFALALHRTRQDNSCEARVDLELVRETRGDRAAAATDAEAAVGYYSAAKEVVEQAPQGCFAGNTDADPIRQDLRENALGRLDAKLAAIPALPALQPPPAPPIIAVPAPPAPGSPAPDDPQRRLHPTQGDPLERLGEILRDAAA
jgi:hypothetical protein